MGIRWWRVGIMGGCLFMICASRPSRERSSSGTTRRSSTLCLSNSTSLPTHILYSKPAAHQNPHQWTRLVPGRQVWKRILMKIKKWKWTIILSQGEEGVSRMFRQFKKWKERRVSSRKRLIPRRRVVWQNCRLRDSRWSRMQIRVWTLVGSILQ